eukprot:scaffold2420_cov259-Pinguiococcus_pyrenoidosus.AAC.13
MERWWCRISLKTPTDRPVTHFGSGAVAFGASQSSSLHFFLAVLLSLPENPPFRPLSMAMARDPVMLGEGYMLYPCLGYILHPPLASALRLPLTASSKPALLRNIIS